MRNHQKLTAIVVACSFLFTPLAWGCEASGMEDCALSDCAMTVETVTGDCHEMTGSTSAGSKVCDVEPAASIACCDSPADPEPAKFETFSLGNASDSPLAVLDEPLLDRLAAAPPDGIADRIGSRQHALGRFTLLSAYLL